jgi:hypothetical protein
VFLKKIRDPLSAILTKIKSFNPKNLSRHGKLLFYIAVGVPVWCILWAFFPYEFYSLFMSSIVGANFFILLICFVVAVLSKSFFARIWGFKPPFVVITIVTTLLLAGVIYIFSIFYYSETPYYVAIYLILPFIVNALIFALSKSSDPKVVLPLIRRKPLMIFAYGFICTVAENLVALMLFVMAKNAFVGAM